MGVVYRGCSDIITLHFKYLICMGGNTVENSYGAYGLEIGGAETHVAELSKELARRGNEIVVVIQRGRILPSLRRQEYAMFSPQPKP